MPELHKFNVKSPTPDIHNCELLMDGKRLVGVTRFAFVADAKNKDGCQVILHMAATVEIEAVAETKTIQPLASKHKGSRIV